MTRTASPTPRTAWVIGASSGIGFHSAQLLRERGFRVVASARRADRLRELDAVAVPVDVTDAESVREGWRCTVAAVGVPGLVLYTAGYWNQTDITEWTSAELERHMDVNVLGLGRVLDHVLPAFRTRQSGQLGVISSVAGYRGVPGAEYYGPTKAALTNLCDALRGSLAADGIGVTAICPGFVDTEMTETNDFPMPFMISPERAAEETVAAVLQGKDEVSFPTRMALTMKTARVLPAPMWSTLAKRFSKR